jgi:hypothetical protein
MFLPASDVCKCETLGENGYFYGDACSCFVFDFKTCNNHGTCINPDFPYGSCKSDLQEYQADALYTPFFIKQVEQGYSNWNFLNGSLFSDIQANKSYLLKTQSTHINLFQLNGTEFDTGCATINNATRKYLYENRSMIFLTQAEAFRVNFTVQLFDSATNATNTIETNTLHLYGFCNVSATYNISDPPCITSYLSHLQELTNITVGTVLTSAEFICVNSFIIFNSGFGSFQCNNVYHRNIDQALLLYFGRSLYRLQCEAEPIQYYSNTIGAFYGLMRDFNATKVARALGNVLLPIEQVSELFFDEYLISWITPYFSANSNATTYGDLTPLLTSIQDIPLNLNVNSSLYPAIDLIQNVTYLKQIWDAYLAPRRCTTNLECMNNDRGDECIYDPLPPHAEWRTGDPSIVVAESVGDEGGCLCDFSFNEGFWTQFCDVCLAGYGPINNCSLPVAFEQVCGPGGTETPNVTVEMDIIVVPTVVVQTDDTFYTTIPRCAELTTSDRRNFSLSTNITFVVFADGQYMVTYERSATEQLNIINDLVFEANGTLASDPISCSIPILNGRDRFFYKQDKEIIPWKKYLAILK